MSLWERGQRMRIWIMESQSEKRTKMEKVSQRKTRAPASDDIFVLFQCGTSHSDAPGRAWISLSDYSDVLDPITPVTAGHTAEWLIVSCTDLRTGGGSTCEEA